MTPLPQGPGWVRVTVESTEYQMARTYAVDVETGQTLALRSRTVWPMESITVPGRSWDPWYPDGDGWYHQDGNPSRWQPAGIVAQTVWEWRKTSDVVTVEL